MKSWLAAVAMAAACAGAALAAGYDDFTSGLTAYLLGDPAGAVTAITNALASPDLAAPHKAAAHRVRARASVDLGQCSAAKADVEAYEALKGRDRTSTDLRFWIALCAKDGVVARTELNALSNDMPVAEVLADLARREWEHEMFVDAAATAREAFKHADKKSALATSILYWWALADSRAGTINEAEFRAALAEIGVKRKVWPGPLFEFILGTRTPEDVRDDAATRYRETEIVQTCQANYVTAEWYLARGDKKSATPLFLVAAKDCPAGHFERDFAQTELKRLNVPVPQE